MDEDDPHLRHNDQHMARTISGQVHNKDLDLLTNRVLSFLFPQIEKQSQLEKRGVAREISMKNDLNVKCVAALFFHADPIGSVEADIGQGRKLEPGEITLHLLRCCNGTCLAPVDPACAISKIFSQKLRSTLARVGLQGLKRFQPLVMENGASPIESYRAQLSQKGTLAVGKKVRSIFLVLKLWSDDVKFLNFRKTGIVLESKQRSAVQTCLQQVFEGLQNAQPSCFVSWADKKDDQVRRLSRSIAQSLDSLIRSSTNITFQRQCLEILSIPEQSQLLDTIHQHIRTVLSPPRVLHSTSATDAEHSSSVSREVALVPTHQDVLAAMDTEHDDF